MKNNNEEKLNSLRELGFLDDGYKQNFEGIISIENQRQQVLDELSSVGFEISLTKEDFITRWYRIVYNNKQVIMSHDFSPYLCFMDINQKHRESFDSAVSNIVEDIKDYLDKFGI